MLLYYFRNTTVLSPCLEEVFYKIFTVKNGCEHTKDNLDCTSYSFLVFAKQNLVLLEGIASSKLQHSA